MPSPALEDMELPRIELPVPEKTITPRPPLKAITLPAPAAVPPIVLLPTGGILSALILIPSLELGNAPVPAWFRPM